MAEMTPRATKLIQYLNEAYGKEKELEVSLQAHVKMAAGRASYKKRLQDHLKETKAQARGLERRIKQLGGKAEAAPLPGPDAISEAAGKATAAAAKAVAAAKGPLHVLRGTGEAEKLLKNAKTELWNEHEEIGNYLAIETLADAVGDRDTAKLAREFRRQEERMASFLSKLIPQLTKAVVSEEIPPADRRAASSNGRARPAKSRARAKPARSRSTAKAKPSRTTAKAKAKPARSRTTAKAKAKPARSRTTAKAKAKPAKSRPAKTSAKPRSTAKAKPTKAAKSRPAKRRAASAS